jgi:sugar lactone lactonase YvrE
LAVSSLCSRRAGAIVGLRDRVALWDYGGEFRTLAIIEHHRLNEGRVGPDGAFWVGTMQNNLHPDGAPKSMTRDSGAIYRIDVDGRVSQLTPREFGITNTMAWTDDARFLTADTTRNAIYATIFALACSRTSASSRRLSIVALPTGRASTSRDASGIAESLAEPVSFVSGPTVRPIDSSTCPARGQPVALSAGPISPRSM